MFGEVRKLLATYTASTHRGCVDTSSVAKERERLGLQPWTATLWGRMGM